MYNFWTYLLSYTIIFDFGAATSDFTCITDPVPAVATYYQMTLYLYLPKENIDHKTHILYE